MISTSRFMLLWAGVTVPPGIAQGPLLRALAGGAAPQKLAAVSLALSAGTTLAVAVLQSILLRRYRRPVRGWIWAALAGFVAGWLINASLSLQLLRMANRSVFLDSPSLLHGYLALQMLSGLLAHAACEGVALWGIRWPGEARLWLAARGLIGLVLYGIARVVHGVTTEPQILMMAALGAAAAASTAWLLDRLAFRELPA